MIKQFLAERLSWILFFILLQLFVLFVGYIDSTIPILPLLYIIFLSMIAFTIFIMVRYSKETRFFQEMDAWDHVTNQEKLAKAERPFEQLIEDKMNDLSEKIKIDMEKQLSSFEQEKDELLSWIHEVKTPLTAMQLMIDRVGDSNLRSQLRYEWLRIHLLLDQQLHQKRLPFLENDLYIEKTDIESLIFHEIKELKSWCIQKGIGFDVQIEGKEVLTDSKWFAFLIRQLLTNAIKYSNASDIIIRTFAHDEQIYLEIQDFGRGIEKKDLPRIYDKGFTSTTNHNDRSSSGMGLYLAKTVADTLKININVQSVVNEGTTFMLIFPKKNEFVHTY